MKVGTACLRPCSRFTENMPSFHAGDYAVPYLLDFRSSLEGPFCHQTLNIPHYRNTSFPCSHVSCRSAADHYQQTFRSETRFKFYDASLASAAQVRLPKRSEIATLASMCSYRCSLTPVAGHFSRFFAVTWRGFHAMERFRTTWTTSLPLKLIVRIRKLPVSCKSMTRSPATLLYGFIGISLSASARRKVGGDWAFDVRGDAGKYDTILKVIDSAWNLRLQDTEGRQSNALLSLKRAINGSEQSIKRNDNEPSINSAPHTICCPSNTCQP